MPKIQKILVGVDGSEYSLRAAEMAADLAMKYSASVLLMFVVGPSDTSMLQGKGDEGSKIGSNELDKAAEIMRRNKVPYDTRVEFGHPADHILSDVHKPDMIVLGTRGQGALKGFLMGSVSTKVSQHSKVPVMVVP